MTTGGGGEPGGAPRPEPGAEPEPGFRWQYEIDAERRAQEAAGRCSRIRRVGGPVGIALLLIWRVGRVVLVALGKVALLFKIPVLGTVFSGAISIGAYAVFLGWPFAIGLVGSLLVHELGHVVQIRREGMPVKALNFVPFLGAYVLTEAPRTPDQQARISIAGPVGGTALALALWAVSGDDPLLRAVAYTGFFLNLINLLPIGFLDGGGVGGVFNRGWWLVAAGATGAAAALTWSGLAALIAIAALVMAWLGTADRSLTLDPTPQAGPGGLPGAGVSLAKAPEASDGVVDAPVPLAARAWAAALYAGVVVVCAVGMSGTFRDRTDELVDRYGAAPLVAPPATVASAPAGAR